MNRLIRLILLATPLILLACRQAPALLDLSPTLPVPTSLPGFAIWPDPPQPLIRSRELTAEGVALLGSGELLKAVQTLTEALSACPADADARLELARSFMGAGRPTVALELLRPASKAMKGCGQCVELLQTVRADPRFAVLTASREGQALLEGLPKEPLPYQRWATEAAAALQRGSSEALASFVHPTFPLRWIRTCPACQNLAARKPEVRDVAGVSRIAKIAQRFDTTLPGLRGPPLSIQGQPTCQGRCCTWSVPAELAAAQVALERICLTPMTPEAAAMSELSLIYGPSERAAPAVPIATPPTDTAVPAMSR